MAKLAEDNVRTTIKCQAIKSCQKQNKNNRQFQSQKKTVNGMTDSGTSDTKLRCGSKIHLERNTFIQI